MPMGPGVDSEMAIMSVIKDWEYQPVDSDSRCKKGRVAMPPPTANRPILKNSQKSCK